MLATAISSRTQTLWNSTRRWRLPGRCSKCARTEPEMHAKIALAGLCLLVLAIPISVLAALGEDASSVTVDREQMQATLQVTASGKFAVHEIQLPSGTTVREYVTPGGTVFAVSWQGPSLPDLRQVLGGYFAQYSGEVKRRRESRGPRAIAQPGLVVRSGGHMRSFFGRAYIPQLLPQGVLAEEIQ